MQIVHVSVPIHDPIYCYQLAPLDVDPVFAGHGPIKRLNGESPCKHARSRRMILLFRSFLVSRKFFSLHVRVSVSTSRPF